MIVLNDLHPYPRWTTHIGCLLACARYHGFDFSDSWLYGASGHGFVLNVHEEVCPSGPTAWNDIRVDELAANTGLTVTTLFGLKTDEDFGDKKGKVRSVISEAIDKGIPCFAWELALPEFYLVHGYDETGVTFSGPGIGERTGHADWETVGSGETGLLIVSRAEKGVPADPWRTVTEALDFALKHATNPAQWIFPGYKSGPAGYDNWIHALRHGKGQPMGIGYNAIVWEECRQKAADFVSEATRLFATDLEPLFNALETSLRMEAECLRKICHLFPFPPVGNESDQGRTEATIDLLRQARSEMENALRAMKILLTTLYRQTQHG